MLCEMLLLQVGCQLMHQLLIYQMNKILGRTYPLCPVNRFIADQIYVNKLKDQNNISQSCLIQNPYIFKNTHPEYTMTVKDLACFSWFVFANSQDMIIVSSKITALLIQNVPLRYNIFERLLLWLVRLSHSIEFSLIAFLLNNCKKKYQINDEIYHK